MERDAISKLNALANGTNVRDADNVQKMQIVTESNDTCQAPAPTINNTINVGNLKNVGGDVISMEIENTDVVDTTVAIGLGLFNVTGTPAAFGVATAAVDNPLVLDKFGAGAAHTQFFSEFVNGHSYIASSVKVFSATPSQAAVAPEFATITPNGDLRRTRAKNIKQNTDLNYIELAACHIPLTFYQGLLYTLKAGETVTIEVEVLGVDMIGDFAEGLGVS